MDASRRRVLVALTAAGSAGALTGRGVSALLTDCGRTRAALATGIVDLTVDYWYDVAGGVDLTDPDGVVDGPRIDVPAASLDEDGRATTLLRFALPQGTAPNNPAALWLRAECPPETTLGELLQVRLSYADPDGTPLTTIEHGSLRAVANALREGVRLVADGPDGCLTSELFVLVEYELDGYVGDESTAFPLSVSAVQCRNGQPTNPFDDATVPECVPGYDCSCDWLIGKVETDEPLIVGQTYDFDEGLTNYAIHVTDTAGDDAVAFELVTTDGSTPLPLSSIHVKGGPDDRRYYRENGAFGTDTTVLDGATDGLVATPPHPVNGSRPAISYVLVGVCAPATPDGDCPDDLVKPAASVGNSGGPGRRGNPGRGGQR